MPQALLVPEPMKENWVFPKLSKGMMRDRKVAPLPKHTFAFDPKPQTLTTPRHTPHRPDRHIPAFCLT